MPENLAAFLLACYLADLIAGDPRTWPHPVRLFGRILDRIEPVIRRSGLNLKACGLGILLAGLFLTLWVTTLITSVPLLGVIISLYLGYASLALGCLIHETRQVQKLIASGSLDEARMALGNLVSRDTGHLDEQGLYRSLAESASENYNDAFCAPFFYLSLLGVPWVWAYKLISTMDSMWGYRTEKWKDLGYAGAKADDILAWIPARLGALSMLAAGYILGMGTKVSLTTIAGDARTMDSPNAGWTMATAAHLLGVSMGGPASYFGEKRLKPVLGRGNCRYTSAVIDNLIRLILISSILYASALIVLALLVSM